MQQASGATPTKRALIFIDLPNLLINMFVGTDYLGFDTELRFKKMLDLVKRMADIEWVLVFESTKPPRRHLYQRFFHNLGFTVITCLHVENAEKEEGDTTDSKLIETAEKMIANYQGITHFCLVSGDHHFAEIIKLAKERGIKVILIPPVMDALSDQLIPLADLDEAGKAMIYSFSQLTETTAITS